MYRYRSQTLWLTALFSLLFASISSAVSEPLAQTTQANTEELHKISLPRGEEKDFGTPPAVPNGALKPEIKVALDTPLVRI